ncbi:EboA domain-containing protein [Micromonospora sp. KC723]|uniref:EboA domain-containing protein n=1 Tax=Micromonospora sp. KC723 TaxID=2530381 RepID=UPI001042E3AF|nr:EboA domain-containing protein [Micromonospora sp. KC723]TDB75513.1 sugar phosphate isomerase [Micromonospora sp. KC723]
MASDECRIALDGLSDDGWLADAERRVARDPASIVRLFAGVGRHCGRAPLPQAEGWTADEAGRVRLLLALPAAAVPRQVEDLYRYGDADEKRAVLKALCLLPVDSGAVPLLHDAIRTNDTRLLAAALGPYARHLDQVSWRQAVLKCVFMGVPLSVVHGLAERADAELAAMIADLRAERDAAGRHLPEDALALLKQLTRRPEVRCASSIRTST